MKIYGGGICDFCGFKCTWIYYFDDVTCVGCGKEYQKCMNIVSGEMNPNAPCKIEMYKDIDLKELIIEVHNKDGTCDYYKGDRFIECISCSRDRKIQEVLNVV